MNSKGTRLMAILLFLLMAPLPTLAHKVTVFAWIEGNTVHTESKFSGGKRVKAGKIEIFDEADRKILEGTTDESGNFDFPRPQAAAALRIVLTAGMGHTNVWQISAEELSGDKLEHSHVHSTPPLPTTDAAPLDAAAIEAIVERAVERKLAPIKAQVAQEAWGLRDIVAGIGYIIGLMGLASYIQFRKKAHTKG